MSHARARTYARLKDTWSTKALKERYVPPVTLPYDQWVQYVASGDNTLLGSGGVIPGGTVRTPFSAGGGVLRGNIGQHLSMYRPGIY